MNKVLLRRAGYLFFSEKVSGWTSVKEDAAEFASIRDAVRFLFQRNWWGSELYIAHPNPAQDFAIPFPKALVPAIA